VTLEETLTPEDWHELELAPLWVLAAVAGADGKIDKAERATLKAAVDRCATHSEPLVSRVFGGLSRDFDARWASYLQDPRFAMHGVRAVGVVLGRVADPAQALHLKQTLVQLGVEVADASGGFGALGRKRSSAEREALKKVSQELRVTTRRLIAASQPFDSILVPLDGSPQAEAALPQARAIAEAFGSKVTLLDVVPLERPGAGAYAAEGFVAPPLALSAEELGRRASAYLDGVRSTYGSDGWRAIVKQGEAAKVIVAEAEASGATLIVMATSGSAGVKRVFEGKVTEDVIRTSDIPVLVVRVADDEF